MIMLNDILNIGLREFKDANISKINKEVGKKDKPLAIFWNKQNNSTIQEEFVIIPKSYFYNLIK